MFLIFYVFALILPFTYCASLYLAITGQNGRPFFAPSGPLGNGAPNDGVPIANFSFVASNSNNRAARTPFVVTRTVDSASPVLLTNLVNNLPMTEIRIVTVFESNGTASGTIGYFYSLSNGRILEIDTFGTAAGVVEKLHFGFDSMQAYFFDGAGSTIANWGQAQLLPARPF